MEKITIGLLTLILAVMSYQAWVLHDMVDSGLNVWVVLTDTDVTERLDEVRTVNLRAMGIEIPINDRDQQDACHVFLRFENTKV